MNIGDNIKNTRLQKKISQKDFAKILDIPVSTLANYENNHREPGIETLSKIAIALEVPLDDLIKDSSVINLNTADDDTKDTYLDFLALSANLRPLAEVIMKCGYTVYKDTNTYEMAIYKNSTHISTVPENDFVKLGEDILKYIQEFTEFEVNKLVDTYSILS